MDTLVVTAGVCLSLVFAVGLRVIWLYLIANH
jgi:hypothetical protein